jgi:hypothetical protein
VLALNSDDFVQDWLRVVGIGQHLLCSMLLAGRLTDLTGWLTD